jgi:threonine dehydrogenase-like Zn-dependent dehydrogenase
VHGPQTAGVAAGEDPVPGPGQAVVRLAGCGVCGSDLPLWSGQPWFTYPCAAGAPGHEGWGTVERVGEGVPAALTGAPVTGLIDNAYASHAVVGYERLVRLPASLEGRPLPGEPLGCAVNVVERSRIGAGDTVAVVGVGFLGALLVRLASSRAARVIAVSRRPFARALAQELGAEHAVELGEGAVEAVAELTGGDLCQVVIEAGGRQATLDAAARLVAVRGRLVVAGYHQDGPRQVDMQLWNWRGIDVINAHEREVAVRMNGIRAAVDWVAGGGVDLEQLLTHRFALRDIECALRTAVQRPDGFLKALVQP